MVQVLYAHILQSIQKLQQQSNVQTVEHQLRQTKSQICSALTKHGAQQLEQVQTTTSRSRSRSRSIKQKLRLQARMISIPILVQMKMKTFQMMAKIFVTLLLMTMKRFRLNNPMKTTMILTDQYHRDILHHKKQRRKRRAAREKARKRRRTRRAQTSMNLLDFVEKDSKTKQPRKDISRSLVRSTSHQPKSKRLFNFSHQSTPTTTQARSLSSLHSHLFSI